LISQSRGLGDVYKRQCSKKGWTLIQFNGHIINIAKCAAF
jgi:hypothetical protein